MSSEVSMWVGEFHRAVAVRSYTVEKTSFYAEVQALLIKPVEGNIPAVVSLREITGILSAAKDAKTELVLAFDEKFPGSVGHTQKRTRTKYSGTVFGSPKVEEVDDEACHITVRLVFASESHQVDAATWD